MAYALLASNAKGRRLSEGRAETLGEAATWLTNALCLSQVASVSVRRLRARAGRGTGTMRTANADVVRPPSPPTYHDLVEASQT